MPPIQMLDLTALHAPLRAELDEALVRVVTSNHFILGPEVKAFEAEAAEYLGAEHCVGVSIGTDALLVALMALGVGPGDEVITTPFSFFATVGCIQRVGATAVFIDVDPVSYNLDVAQLEAAVTERTRAIIPVHLFGQPCDIQGVMDVATRHGLPVVEDAAQSMGAATPLGQSGVVGALGCFSFFPSKNLGGLGDGGLVVARDAEMAERLRVLRAHGAKPKYHHHVVGGNFRLDALQAAALRVKLPHLDDWNAARRERARWYLEAFENDAATVPHALPRVTSSDHTYNQFVVRVAERDRVQKALSEASIPSAVYYPAPLHLQPCMAGAGFSAGQFPVAEQACREVLALPINPTIEREQVRHVVTTLSRILEERIPEATGESQ